MEANSVSVFQQLCIYKCMASTKKHIPCLLILHGVVTHLKCAERETGSVTQLHMGGYQGQNGQPEKQ